MSTLYTHTQARSYLVKVQNEKRENKKKNPVNAYSYAKRTLANTRFTGHSQLHRGRKRAKMRAVTSCIVCVAQCVSMDLCLAGAVRARGNRRLAGSLARARRVAAFSRGPPCVCVCSIVSLVWF